MAEATEHPFNPCCDVPVDEQIPAKIWELLRRNVAFRKRVAQLRRLDEIERSVHQQGKGYHGSAWEKSCALLRKVKPVHPFAHVAFMWLVPEPLLNICRLTYARNGKLLRKQVCPLVPTQLDKPEGAWLWRSEGSHLGWPTVRGPEIHLLTSNKRKRCDRVIFRNEWRGWKPEAPLFDCDTPWPETPAGFRHAFMFLWRSRYDSRPDNPITRNRDDSPQPHETGFFRGWNLSDFNVTRDLAKVLTFDDLACNYRVFAVPRTILTKGTADAMGKWLAAELKQGNEYYGRLLKRRLFNERELLGSGVEWREFLQASSASEKNTHFYRRRRYLNSLIAKAYPCFDIAALLAPPKHRARGKQYVPKVRQK